MPKVTRIHHVAVVVDDMQKSLTFWRDALGLPLQGTYDVSAMEAQVAFLPTGGSAIELVKPTSEDSGIAKFLARRGPGLHHICVEVDNIQAMLDQLKNRGVRLINDAPLTEADGRKYAFIHPESTNGVLVELYEISG